MSQIAAFHEVRFPTDIAFGSSGGPERSTEIVTLGSSREVRNQRWKQSRRRYDAGYGVKDLNGLYEVIDFYEARRGPLFGFRFRDPLDCKSCAPLTETSVDDQAIGTGDGTQKVFEISKSYGLGEMSYQRRIKKLVPGTFSMVVDGMSQTVGDDFVIDYDEGIVTFSSQNAPALNAQITAGFEFDVPVRFASDQLTISIAAFTAGEVPNIPLVEIAV